MQDFRPDDDLRMDRPSRVARRQQPKKKNNSLQLYLFIGLGSVILIGLVIAVWLILREPSVNIENTSTSQASSSGQLDLGSLNSGTSSHTATIQTDNQLSLPNLNELPEIQQATGNQATDSQTEMTQTMSNNEMNNASFTNNRSTLPLDYSTAGNKAVSAANNVNNTEIDVAQAEKAFHNPTQVSNQATQTKPVPQNTQPSTDFTSQPKSPELTKTNSFDVSDTKAQPKPEIQIKQENKIAVQPENKKKVDGTKITPQTTTIKNSQPNTRPVPIETQQQEILTTANNIQESANSLQNQINQETQNTNSNKTLATKTPSQPNIRPAQRNSVQQGSIDNGTGGDFTIQVASASQPEGLRKLAASKGLITARVIETERNGGKWYVLVTGNYSSRQDAQRAIRTLPTDLQSNGAWVRQK